MAGHSKWANIKHRKGAQDAKRSKVFSRIAKMIIVAAQNGGGDPEMNNSLKMLMDQARKVNMPKDNIERAIKAGTGEGSAGVRFEEVVYEAMGPEGSMMIITAATDNTNRTITDVKTALKKNNGKFVPTGSVSFQFNHVGQILLTTADLDSAELKAIDAGATDVEQNENQLLITTEVTDLHKVQELLKPLGEIESAEIIYTPTQDVTLSESALESYTKLYEIIEEIDDVVDIFDNVTK